jgi:cyclopropane-fatty-acyl-phospholipid synthase
VSRSKSAARGRESRHTVHPGSSGAATDVLSILQAAVGGPLPIRVRCWDGSVAGDPDAAATVVFVRRRGLRRLLWAPGELGLVRAYVSGDMHIEGDIFALLDLPDVIDRIAHHQVIGLSSGQRLAAAVTAARIGAVGPPPRPPAEEIRRRRGRLHSISRDAQSVSHHYDVGNEFYRLILGPSMAYSCAYWAQETGPGYGLDEAQRDKCELPEKRTAFSPIPAGASSCSAARPNTRAPGVTTDRRGRTAH